MTSAQCLTRLSVKTHLTQGIFETRASSQVVADPVGKLVEYADAEKALNMLECENHRLRMVIEDLRNRP